MKQITLVGLLLLSLTAVVPAIASSENLGDCLAMQSADWSESEVWAWGRLCHDQTVDMNLLTGSTGDLRPWQVTEGEWDSERILSSQFLYDILREDHYRSAMSNKRIAILGAWFPEAIDLRGVRIDNFFALTASRFDRNFDFQAGITKSRFSLENSWFRADFFFNSMTAAEVDLSGARFDGEAGMWDIDSSRSILLGGNQFAGYVILAGSKADELVMSAEGKESVWIDNAQLSLRDVRVNILEDTEASWIGLEGRLDLQGFQYARFGGVSDSFDPTRAGGTGSERPIDSLLAWLAMQENRDEIYIPQPYEQLAAVLAEAGQTAKAKQILYQMNEYRRIHASTGPGEKAWLTTKKIIIGYGYQVWLTVLWFGVLILGGAVLLRFSVQGRRNLTLARSLLYSLDQALPLVYLNPLHEDLARQHPLVLQYYFQIHQVLSLILLSFLGAGLAGAIG